MTRRHRVLSTHRMVEGGLALFESRDDVELEVAADLQQEAELVRAVPGFEALIPVCSTPITAEVLTTGTELKVVANCAAGFDNVDLDTATRRGIWVTNTPGVLTEATADLTWAALLGLVRRVVEGDRLVRAGGFHGFGPALLLGQDLAGKTLGVVGLGQIGRAVARRAAGFSMRLIHTDPTHQGLVDLGLATSTPAPLERLLAEADVVTLHTPLTPATRCLINADRLRLMKPTAYLVNTSRGSVVDERALVEHLARGAIAGAALDVYEREPELAVGLRELTNVLLLPHLGSATVETRRRMAALAAQNVLAVLDGRTPPNPVNRPC